MGLADCRRLAWGFRRVSQLSWYPYIPMGFWAEMNTQVVYIKKLLRHLVGIIQPGHFP